MKKSILILYWMILALSAAFSQTPRPEFKSSEQFYQFIDSLSHQTQIEQKIISQTQAPLNNLDQFKFQLSQLKKSAPTSNYDSCLVLAYGTHEPWASLDYLSYIYLISSLKGYNPDRNLFCLFGNGTSDLPYNLTNSGPANKINLAQFMLDHQNLKLLELYQNAHGGGYRARAYGNFFGYSTVLIQVGNDPSLDHDTNECDLELGIFYHPWGGVIPLNSFSRAYFEPVDEQNTLFRVEMYKYVPCYFFTNSQGKKISYIWQEVYYLQYANEDGIVPWSSIIWEDKLHLLVDKKYFYPYPKYRLFTDSLDIDHNGLQDVPLAITLDDTFLLSIDLNAGADYNYLNLSPNGVDYNGDGFIKGFDLDENNIIDPFTPVSFQAVVLLDNELMSDLELQAILNLLPDSTLIIAHYLHCYGADFADNPPRQNSILFASAPDSCTASCNPYPLNAMLDILSTSGSLQTPLLNYMNLFNSAHAWTGTSYAQRYNYLLQLNDNQDREFHPGPWPNSSDGQFSSSINIYIPLATPVNLVSPLPSTSRLYTNYPNPFNFSTMIKFELAQAGQVKLTIFNTHGQTIQTLLNEFKSIGSHSINWLVPDLPSGIYVCHLHTPTQTFSSKMTLLK